MTRVPYLNDLRSIWSSDGPTSGRRVSPVAAVLMSLLVVQRFCSLSMLKYCAKENTPLRREFMHLYVVCWTVLLTLMLFFSAPAPTHLVPLLAALEIFDILAYRLYFVFVKSRATHWTSSAIRRTLFMAALNLLEIVIGFAILYRHVGHIISTFVPALKLSAISALYFSLVTLTTVGYGDFVPGDDPSRLLVMSEIVSGRPTS